MALPGTFGPADCRANQNCRNRDQFSHSNNVVMKLRMAYILCFVDRASLYNRIKKNQLDAQLILSIFRQTVRVSGVSRPIFRRYNRMYKTIGTYYYF